MTTDVAAVDPSTAIRAISDLLDTRRISAVPVVEAGPQAWRVAITRRA